MRSASRTTGSAPTGARDVPTLFVDADVLIAGSNSAEGASHLILQLGELGLIDLVSSAQVRAECERNLRVELPAALPAFGLLARTALRWIEDLPILVAAMDAGCSALITFNTRDFDPPSGALLVETPGDFLRRLRQLLAQTTGEPG